MATQGDRFVRSFVAGEDLSAAQYHGVKLVAGPLLNIGDTAGEAIIGVLENTPASGETGKVCLLGVTKAKMGGTVAAQDPLQVDADGELIVATTADEIIGKALEAGVDQQVITILVTNGGIF